MVNRKYIVGNMKMNFHLEDIKEYLQEMNDKVHSSQVVFCPSAIYAPYFIDGGFETGLQNTSQYEKGAYTGEISPFQAKSMGCKYTILGHSERRSMFHETDEIVCAKVKKALEAGLTVILCVGETEEQRENGIQMEVLKSQLSFVFGHLSKEESERMIIAYEPIWAIGTGRIPTTSEIDEVAMEIDRIVTELGFSSIPVLYGGSVNAENIEVLNQIEHISGFLVGGACLKIEQFLHMIEVVL